MKDLGSKALQKIENLITKKEEKPKHSPKKQKSLINFKPSRIVDDQTPKKSPSKPTYSPLKKTPSSVYIPRQREIRLLEKQTKAIYAEMEQRVNYRVQNTHSFFLNKRNPKPPIYERAEQIMRIRQANLEEKRQAKIREKQQEEQREYQQFLKSQLNKKALSKQQAFSITDRLYKDHYLKNNRLNQQKIQRYMQQSKYYREKPLINNVSRQLYHVVAEKNKLQADIIDRFGQYQLEKAEKQKETIKNYQNLYTPFRPLISDNSRTMVSARDEKSHDMSRSSNHCTSCNCLKGQHRKSTTARSPARQPGKSVGLRSFYDDQA